MMDETEFWRLVDDSRDEAEGDVEVQADLLVERLTALDPEQVVDFSRHFEARWNRAYTWDVWAACVLLTDAADEDTFAAFRCWLIAQGREVFESALYEADELADLLADFDPETDGDGEDVGYAADEAYERLTGGELPDLGLGPAPEEPTGEPLDPADRQAVADRAPRLAERFGS
ncbi:DUF4240 domain-containing protein [Streptomyces sp. NPDC059740]|uniref:DUF4240 domain-containing protein n=1 Tax=Streptomyces sp. NPDC059740 TaxID=3346926 RepID=UPI003658D1B5